MNTKEIIQWLELESIKAEKEGRRIASKTLADAAVNLMAEINRKNAANIAALDRKQVR